MCQYAEFVPVHVWCVHAVEVGCEGQSHAGRAGRAFLEQQVVDAFTYGCGRGATVPAMPLVMVAVGTVDSVLFERVEVAGEPLQVGYESIPAGCAEDRLCKRRGLHVLGVFEWCGFTPAGGAHVKLGCRRIGHWSCSFPPSWCDGSAWQEGFPFGFVVPLFSCRANSSSDWLKQADYTTRHTPFATRVRLQASLPPLSVLAILADIRVPCAYAPRVVQESMPL